MVIKMKKIKILLIMLLVIIVALSLSGCVEQTSVGIEEKYTANQMKEMNAQVGMPVMFNFNEKKLAKQIFELRDKADLITYAYTVNLDGQYVYLGKCIGFGLPYSVQYTNPEKIIGDPYRYQSGGKVVPQADPNGLYMPEGLSATWLVLVNEDTGKREVIYAEPEIVVTQSKLPKRLVADWSLPKNY